MQNAHRNRSIVSDASAYVAARILAAVAATATTVLLAATLSKGQFGGYGIATMLAGLAVVVTDIGLTSSLARSIAQGRADRSLLLRVAGIKASLCALAAGGMVLLALATQAGWLFAAGDRELLASLFALSGLLVVGQTFSSFCIGLFPALRRTKSLIWLTVSQSVLELAGVAAVLHYGLDVQAVLGASIAAALSIGLLGFVSLAKRAPKSAEPAQLGSVLTYGLPILGVWICVATFGVIDPLLITSFHGAAAAAPYMLAFKAIAVFGIPALGVASVVSARLAGGGPSALRLFEGWLRLLVVGYVGIAAVAAGLAPAVFDYAAGKYADDGVVLTVLAGYIALLGVATFASVAANYLGGSKARMRIALTTVVCNVALDLILIPRYGIFGAAFSTTVAYGWYTLAHTRLSFELLGRTVSTRTVFAKAPALLAPGLLAGSVAAALSLMLPVHPIPAITVAASVAALVYLRLTRIAVRPLRAIPDRLRAVGDIPLEVAHERDEPAAPATAA